MGHSRKLGKWAYQGAANKYNTKLITTSNMNEDGGEGRGNGDSGRVGEKKNRDFFFLVDK